MPRTGLPLELEPIDRALDRWAYSDRPRPQLHPLERMRLLHDGATFSEPIPDPPWFGYIDDAVNRGPTMVKAFVNVWYIRDRGAPSHVKAERLGISRRTIYFRWQCCLYYVRGALGDHLHELPG